MSAGTIVITGGILAGVILLCIVAVLCYCRLQELLSDIIPLAREKWKATQNRGAPAPSVAGEVEDFSPPKSPEVDINMVDHGGPRAYYCCKKNDSEVDMGSVVGADPLSHFPCNACNALAMDGADITPVSLDQLDAGSHHNHCPTCSPYSLRSGLTADMRNGGERLGFHTYYENPSVSLPLSVNPQSSSPLSYYSPTDMFPPPPRPYSTQV